MWRLFFKILLGFLNITIISIKFYTFLDLLDKIINEIFRKFSNIFGSEVFFSKFDQRNIFFSNFRNILLKFLHKITPNGASKKRTEIYSIVWQNVFDEKNGTHCIRNFQLSILSQINKKKFFEILTKFP